MVLVRATQLLQQLKDMDISETPFRFEFSHWSQRFWTTQETVAATKLPIYFLYGTVDFDEL